MRHPLLRILVALFIGVITPLCCCVVQAVAENACGGQHSAAVELASCCNGCSTQPGSDQDQDDPTEEPPSSPEKCPSCPSCQGTSGGTGAKAEIRVPAIEQVLDALATIALAAFWNLPPLDAEAAPPLPGWASDPPFLKANREALRWHCALLV